MTKLNLAGPEGREFKEVAESFGVPWIMTSFYYHKASPSGDSGEEWTLDYRANDHCKGIMMDSGAFSFISSSEKMARADQVDWWEYTESYAEYIRDNEVRRYIELDLDSVVGYDEVLRMREYLEETVGWPPIPVWHRNRGKEAFIESAKNYPRVALGGFPWREIPESKWHVLPWFIKKAHKYGARIHALGFQPTTNTIEKYPFDSTDSMNWKWNGIYGILYKWDGRRMEEHEFQGSFDRPKRKHNLKEWVKYARYLDGKNEAKIGQEW